MASFRQLKNQVCFRLGKISLLRGGRSIRDAYDDTLDFFSGSALQFPFVAIDLIIHIAPDDEVGRIDGRFLAGAARVNLSGGLEGEVKLLFRFLVFLTLGTRGAGWF